MTYIEKLQKEVQRRYEHHIDCMKRSKDDNYPALSNAMHGVVKDELFEILCFMDSLKIEQMMTKAIDGDVTFDYYGDDDKTYGCIAHDSFCLEDFGLKDRDKVKVIIIKDE